MNQRQKRCMERLRKALDACHKAGLMGGVYEGSFFAWSIPGMEDVDPKEQGSRFFEAVAKIGGDSIQTLMSLDGGSGS